LATNEIEACSDAGLFCTPPIYGTARADMERKGKTLAPLDLLIAAHALGVGATLVTNDRTFGQVVNLHIEDWTV